MVLGILIWGYFTYIQQLDPQALRADDTLSEAFYGEHAPLAGSLSEIDDPDMNISQINERVPEPYRVVMHKENLTGDEHRETLAVKMLNNPPSLAQTLMQDGYEEVIESFMIYRHEGQQLIPLFTVTPESMLNAEGDPVIDMEPADPGFAIQTSTFEHEQLYEHPTTLIYLIMVDRQGQPASDELTVYWDPGEQLYKATNTFGAPGTFSQ